MVFDSTISILTILLILSKNQFGFGSAPRRDNITAEDKTMSFYTKIGTAEIRAKFTLKEMMYQGKLAL